MYLTCLYQLVAPPSGERLRILGTPWLCTNTEIVNYYCYLLLLLLFLLYKNTRLTVTHCLSWLSGSSGAVCSVKRHACTICSRKNETPQWQTVCTMLRLSNRSQPDLINFRILLLSLIACVIMISLYAQYSILYRFYCTELIILLF